MTAIDSTGIHARALLVALHISTWSARRYDKDISAEVNQRHNASNDASRVNKLLLPGDAKAYRQMIAIAGAIRTQHYANTLAWSDDGWRLLPTANYATYTGWLRQRQTEFEHALNEFATDYPTLRAQAQIRLNGMYKDSDYPTASEIRSKFALSVDYQPVPAKGDVRVDLGSDQVALIETAIANRLERATADAMRDAWSRLFDCVTKASERLGDPEAIFRDSLISNIEQTCDVLARLNVTDDPNLESMRQRVRRELTRYAPDMLRETGIHARQRRQETADRAADILKTMQGFFS